MAQTNDINWIAPTDSDVGSVLIYRATDREADSLGSRSIIDTVDASVTSYTDINGDPHSIYRIRFWDGVGSGPFSDPISVEENFSEYFATIDEVKQVSNIGDNYDIGSREIFDAIQDATWEHYGTYGDPIKRSVIFVDSTGSPAYDITGDMAPIYQVRKVTLGTTEGRYVNGSSYDIDFSNGNMSFEDAFINQNEGEYIWIEWVPRLSNIIVKNMAGINLIEGMNIVQGGEVDNPDIGRLQRKIDGAVEAMRPKGAFTVRNLNDEYVKQTFNETGMWADYIAQKLDRASLRFTK